jgi:hypothetical protein
MTRATALVAVDHDRDAAKARICDQLDAFGLGGRRVEIRFDDMGTDTVRCDPPTEHTDAADPPELPVYLQGTRGDWVSAVRVMSYAGGGL